MEASDDPDFIVVHPGGVDLDQGPGGTSGEEVRGSAAVRAGEGQGCGGGDTARIEDHIEGAFRAALEPQALLPREDPGDRVRAMPGGVFERLGTPRGHGDPRPLEATEEHQGQSDRTRAES